MISSKPLPRFTSGSNVAYWFTDHALLEWTFFVAAFRAGTVSEQPQPLARRGVPARLKI